MSSMPEQKPTDRASVRQKIENLEAELQAWKTLDQQLELIERNASTKGLKGLFLNMPPYDAICAFLTREGKPRTREVIIAAVIEGGARLGKDKDKSINQSLSTNVGLKKLKEMNGLVGLVDWPEKRFQSS